MAITIKPFSYINSGTQYYYTQDKLFNPELKFTSSYNTLYFVVARKVPGLDRYELLQQSKLSGYNNNTNYDYRINLQNFIKIKHDDNLTLTNIVTNSYLIEGVNENNQSGMFILISNLNILAYNAASITTDSNGIKWSTYTQINSYTGMEFRQFITFYDAVPPMDVVISELYTNSFLTILIPHNSYELYNVTFIDKNSIPISGYGFVTGISPNPGNYGLVLCKVPDNVASVSIIYYNDVSDEVYVTKKLKGCAYNQYFYFGNTIMNTLICQGKRENVRTLTRQSIKSGLYTKNLLLNYNDRYEQNTGFFLTEEQLMDLSLTPFLFEIDNNKIVTYNITNSEFKGYNTRSLSNKNDVLVLEKRLENTKFTSPSNTFYD